jgi:hypothetical protein
VLARAKVPMPGDSMLRFDRRSHYQTSLRYNASLITFCQGCKGK